MSNTVFETYLQSAYQLGRRTAEAAIWQGACCTWPQPEGAQVMDGTLYEGTAGIGWFLSQLAAATGDSLLRRTAEGAARHSLEWASSTAEDGSANAGLYTGTSGALWAVAEIGRAGSTTDLVDRVGALLPHLLKRSPAIASAGDIISGEAGTLVALIGLARHNPQIREAVCEAGTRFAAIVGGPLAELRLRQEGENLPQPVGLAHGVSGLVWSLLKLYRFTGVQSYLGLARQGLRYERAWFDRGLCTWRDPITHSPLGSSWCNGSIGIGLVRTYGCLVSADSCWRAEAGAALASAHATIAGIRGIRNRPAWEQDNCSICHGIFGIADMLLFAAQAFGIEAHREAGQYLVDYGHWLASQRSDWPCGTIDSSVSYGLMLGLSGIGMVLLRYAGLPLSPVGLAVYSTSE